MKLPSEILKVNRLKVPFTIHLFPPRRSSSPRLCIDNKTRQTTHAGSKCTQWTIHQDISGSSPRVKKGPRMGRVIPSVPGAAFSPCRTKITPTCFDLPVQKTRLRLAAGEEQFAELAALLCCHSLAASHWARFTCSLPSSCSPGPFGPRGPSISFSLARMRARNAHMRRHAGTHGHACIHAYTGACTSVQERFNRSPFVLSGRTADARMLSRPKKDVVNERERIG